LAHPDAPTFPDRVSEEETRGAVVHVYEPDGVEVEFVTASGRTQALVTLKTSDLRAVSDQDLLSVRPLRHDAA
jgi:hypothetical protein